MNQKTRVPAQAPPETDPKVQELMTNLLNESVTLVMKLAICKCDKRDNCKVYEVARRMAMYIDKLQELRPARIPIERRAKAKPSGVA